MVHIPYREGGPERFDRLEIKQSAVHVGFPKNPPGPLKPVSLIKLKRVIVGRGLTQRPRQNSRIFDRHRGALCQIREGRMRRVANQGGTPGAPIVQSGIDIQCPTSYSSRSAASMMRVNILVPAIKVGLLLPPRTLERTGFLDPLIEFHASDKIQQTTAT